jgi:membrane protease YdiL (CAAX protease family)
MGVRLLLGNPLAAAGGEVLGLTAMMSTLLGDSTDPLPVLKSPVLLGAAVIAIAIAAVAGVFRSGSIRGPRRLSSDESAGNLLGPLGVALCGWSLGILALSAWAQSHNPDRSQPPKLGSTAEVVCNGLLDLIVFALLIGVTRSLRRDGIRRLGIGVRRLPFGLVAGLIGIIIVMPLMYYVDGVTEFLLDKRHIPHEAHDLLIILKETRDPWLKITVVFVAGFLAPIAEETFFRGCLQTFFRYSLKSPWAAVFLTSALFALIHPMWTWPQIFFLGACMGYLYERTGNLWANITMHALFNLSSIAVYWRFEK